MTACHENDGKKVNSLLFSLYFTDMQSNLHQDNIEFIHAVGDKSLNLVI
jgi:hypothetical protein